MHEKNAKIISLVPSWTETFAEAGLNIVGRTAYCLYPPSMAHVPVVGGTKNMKIKEIESLRPDFVILDQEENKKEMAEALQKIGIELLVSKVRSLESAAEFLDSCGQRFQNAELTDWADIYRSIHHTRHLISKEKFYSGMTIRKNSEPLEGDRIEYVIWKNPSMVIGRETFIADVLSLAGLELSRPEKYPVVEETEIKKNYCLFSSEPYDFAKKFTELTQQGWRGALVDGEKVSWYGLRNLRFLQSSLR